VSKAARCVGKNWTKTSGWRTPFLAASRAWLMRLLSAGDTSSRQAEREYQKAELERSFKYCKDVIGLGVRG
jgi:hypothetical protein